MEDMAHNPSLPTDPTIDEIRGHLAPLIASNAAFDGWSSAALNMAAQHLGIVPEIAALAFTGGPVDMIDAWFAHIDAAMLAACPPERLATMKVNEKIRTLVEARLALIVSDKESLRRALAILAMPQNLAKAARLSWRAADVMWQAAGDVAVDYNHYTKRMMLAGIYSATLLALLDDESEGHADSHAFLTRRIGDVMRFEKAKARLSANRERRPSLARFVGRLRYHAR
jgi:ubiquinone biosynthesis protein COQ9